jgi:acyl-coenzyme A thioesterase PaaI-like protein
MADENAFLKLISSPFKFRLFLFSKLPSAYFSGVRVKDADEKKCVVTVPYKWFSQNPFRSTYFACLSMAAEMSTGILAMANTSGRKPPVSMLVVHLEASYFKKATGLTTFVCSQGEEIKRIVEEAVATGEPKTYRAKSVGTNENGEVVAEFYITWSFKAKTAFEKKD